MTAAFQSGQFHTDGYDRPATEPSIFQAMASPPDSAVEAELVVTERLAEAAGDFTAPEPEE